MILQGLEYVEVAGISGVAVKCVDIRRNTDGEGSPPVLTDADGRKRGERTGLDTLVVHAVNDANFFGSESDQSRSGNPVIPPGEYGKVKPKGIDGDPQQAVDYMV